MQHQYIYDPRQALNKAFLKLKPTRKEIDVFKANFERLLRDIDDKESEEFHKNLVTKFLRDTYYKNDFFINTDKRKDQLLEDCCVLDRLSLFFLS